MANIGLFFGVKCYFCRMVLVTGGTGMVGSHLLLELVRSGESVKALKRGSSDIEQVKRVFAWYDKDAEELFAKIHWVDGDILDIFSLEEAMEGVSEVYHCAGLVSYYRKDRFKLQRINHFGTANVVNTALRTGINKLCHVSSVSALGKEKQGETISEDHLWKTSKHNPYFAISKYAGEREVWRGMEEGLDAVVVIPSIIIGPGKWDWGSNRIFSTVWNGMPFYSNGVNGYIDVRDVAGTMVRLMKSDIKNERFILSAEDVTFRVIIELIAEAMGKKPPFIKLAPWMGEAGWRLEQVKLLAGIRPTFSREIAHAAFNKFYFSSEKIKTMLEYDFIPIEKAVENTAAYFLKTVLKT
jgi:nucleoside-diphosphate-sugar epimerase